MTWPRNCVFPRTSPLESAPQRTITKPGGLLENECKGTVSATELDRRPNNAVRSITDRTPAIPITSNTRSDVSKMLVFHPPNGFCHKSSWVPSGVCGLRQAAFGRRTCSASLDASTPLYGLFFDSLTLEIIGKASTAYYCSAVRALLHSVVGSAWQRQC